MERVCDGVATPMRRRCSQLLEVLFLFFLLPAVAEQVNAAAAAETDPLEVQALNSIFSQWKIPFTSDWNISGNPCTGNAIKIGYNLDQDGNHGIRCDCSYDGNSTCHIIQLMVINLDVVGIIPEELQYLKYLRRLKLDKNYLTGSLPAFVGNFTNLTFLSVAFNSLSGTIPKELGNLAKLTILSLGHNNFSGSLPPELGTLVNLERFYGNSLGLGGDIPPTFAKLQNLKIVYMMDNYFTGRIPDFIGGWTNLTELRLYGNLFQGPIPSSFTNLSNLNILQIGEVNGSSSLAFIRNLKQLNTLVLRNCMISDTLPDFFDEFTSLLLLDLSFNNISGSIPNSLFKSRSLTSLLLGSNSLSGNLPSEKSSVLRIIDLSYNKMSGSFPSWVNQGNLFINLVSNNFVEADIDSSTSLPLGLNCLQEGGACANDYYQFGINCGGPETRASDGTMYEDDQSNLGAAKYYVSSARNWAVSNVGIFPVTNDQPYADVNENLPDVKLFQDLRYSASSLRYYGLGLQNGNYSITLDFIELTFSNNRTWKSLGRRVFDIFIQGELKEKDFDIRKEAGGDSYTAVSKEYTALVTQGRLEIHLFWAGKGTSAIPSDGNYGPSIAAVRVKPNFKPVIRKSTGSHKVLIASITCGIVVLLFFIIGVIFWRRARSRNREMDTADEEFQGLTFQPHCFPYSELRSATDDFSTKNKLGEGGFGYVYKGKLSDGRLVAVKQLSHASNHGMRQFTAEIATISAVQHRNLVKLYGCCYEGDRKLLVYEYLENKSLDQCLFGNKLQIDWPTRFKICLGTARGLAYLHEESEPRIIHRDIKAANILLDGELNPKISDFGLARLYDDKKTHISTNIAGTLGYLAPEYAMKGRLTEKTDVFAFGVVTLEIVSGRPNLVSSMDEDKMYLLEWAWRMHKEKNDLELVDQSLQMFDQEEAINMIRIALLCTQAAPELRPTMSQVVGMLAGDFQVNEVKSAPGYSVNYLGNYANLSDASTSTSNQSNSTWGGWSMSNQVSTSAEQITGTSSATSTKEKLPMLVENR